MASEGKTPPLKAMNSIPNPRMYLQVENLKPRERQSLYQATQQMTIMIESRFGAGRGSQCCLWIFLFSPYQIKTLIDKGTEATWEQKSSLPEATELRVTRAI